MFFQSKKKRLWRARVQMTATHHANQQNQQQNHHQLTQSQQPHCSYYQNSHQNNHHYHQGSPTYMRENSVMTSSQSYLKLPQTLKTIGQELIEDQENVTNGCYYGEIVEEMSGCDEDQTTSSTTSTGSSMPTKYHLSHHHYHQLSSTNSPNMKTGTIPMETTSTPVTLTYSMAATAANVLLNCCRGGNTGNYCSNNINTNLNSNNNNHNHNSDETQSLTENGMMNVTEQNQKQIFRGLMSKLKESQLTTLLHVVDTLKMSSNGNGGGRGEHQQDCVLVPRGTISGEEPQVIACRLWRWPDLRNANELKSIPSCPSEKDRVYVCCNPSHWSRLCVPPDIPPPPYQPSAMDRLKTEGQSLSENIGEDLRVQFPESFTTDGDDSSTSSIWCQLAYWELTHRVGGLFPVENSSVNVFFDEPQGDGMCLKTLAEQRQSATLDVLKARQKIGLGVTLSQETDGVWLYNRSSVPVFVHSPTLNDIDCWLYVSKVSPGYCLKAFDNYRAKSLIWPQQIAGAQTGPIDIHSMRISFAKGWGKSYTNHAKGCDKTYARGDITGCPCWLEVLLTRR